MPISNPIKPILAICTASSIIVSFTSSTSANKFAVNEIKPMAQDSENNPNRNEASKIRPIRYPDHVMKEIEERDRKLQRERNEAQSREIAKKSPKEREEIEREIRKQRDNKFAPERRTEEELKLEDEKVMRLMDKLREEKEKK